MADEESQVEEDTSWWAIEAFPDVELPSMSLDEPLEWPDSLPWEEYSSGAPDDPPAPPADLVFPVDAAPEAAIDPGPAPDTHVEWQPGGYDPDDTMAATALAGLGGGATEAAAVDPATEVQPLPDSIWSSDSEADGDDAVAGLASLHAPLVYADTDGRGRIQGLRRFDISRGNVAIVALISAVSLVLLGMFLSVRSRNDVPTDATASPPRTDQIATANTRNSVPVTTTAVTTTVPGPSINIADLVAPADTAGAGTAGPSPTAGAGGGGTATTGRTPVATTAPARSNTAPAGGGGGSGGATQPAPQPPATTAAPEPPPDTTPATSPPPPPDDTTNTTNRPRVTTPPPTFPTPTMPDVTVPSGGGSFPNVPGVTFPARDDDD